MRKTFLAAVGVALCELTLLSACASAPISGPPRQVEVQVPVSCVSSKFPSKPDFTDDPISLLATDMAGRDALLKGNYFLHQAWEAALERQIKDCLPSQSNTPGNNAASVDHR